MLRVREYVTDKGNGATTTTDAAHLGDEPVILKTAWKSSQRDPESHIHENVEGKYLGLTEYVLV
ncbi:hypothetical protein NEOLEDRAFT_1132618 [Neolentinus lepideus HHB14362 ss-1]|uniref:Uncharacterized protein n=1 Tax=Neolentinus lepideus HHB14362 ss-1 TaxID=1314782 RepID=A0A165T3A1_9AGAM|nr:hypothetical protein NEOLEDRAFT_1132618 [Neolentinus lepideus HHB14362 ss-1]